MGVSTLTLATIIAHEGGNYVSNSARAAGTRLAEGALNASRKGRVSVGLAQVTLETARDAVRHVHGSDVWGTDLVEYGSAMIRDTSFAIYTAAAVLRMLQDEYGIGREAGGVTFMMWAMGSPTRDRYRANGFHLGLTIRQSRPDTALELSRRANHYLPRALLQARLAGF